MRLFSRLSFATILMGSFASLVFSAQEYKGTVVTMADQFYSTTTGGYDRGWVNKAAKLGQICVPYLYDSKKDIVFPGTTLIDGYDGCWIGAYIGDKYALEGDEALRNIAYDNYVRYRKLLGQNACAQQDYETTVNAFAGAEGTYQFQADQIAMDNQQNIMMTTRTPTEGDDGQNR